MDFGSPPPGVGGEVWQGCPDGWGGRWAWSSEEGCLEPKGVATKVVIVTQPTAPEAVAFESFST